MNQGKITYACNPKMLMRGSSAFNSKPVEPPSISFVQTHKMANKITSYWKILGNSDKLIFFYENLFILVNTHGRPNPKTFECSFNNKKKKTQEKYNYLNGNLTHTARRERE